MNMQDDAAWRPSATLETLRARAALLKRIRIFFEALQVLEVETPVLSMAATVDRQIESFRVGGDGWLATSPEFAMKRLLAAGSGPIYQVSRVFRAEEAGRHHNPEFTLLEWYRPGFSLSDLMSEVEMLIRSLDAALPAFERLTYAEAIYQAVGIDPLRTSAAQLRTAAAARGLLPNHSAVEADDIDFWLDWIMASTVGPRLGIGVPTFLYHFPPSQAALARIVPGPPPVAKRFELFWDGIELANGFHELADAAEQQDRFKADQAWRRGRGRVVPPFDRALIDAIAHGLPDCCGVAIGLDRLLMRLLKLDSVAETLAFAADRA